MSAARHKKPPAHPRACSAANGLCALHRHLGEPSIRPSDASCTSQDGAADVKPEGQRGVQEGGHSTPKGGRRLRPLEQKKKKTTRPPLVGHGLHLDMACGRAIEARLITGELGTIV